MPEGRVTSRAREAVIQRAAGCCEYCGSRADYAMDPFSVEHILPRSVGGKNTLDNLALACLGCNSYKHTKTEAFDAISHRMAFLYNPRQHQWHEHFAWNADCTQIIGLTPIGRVTIAELQLNRPGLLNLRRLLYAAGEHPPEAMSGW
ncbi:MAG: HNH endonuclease [Chloroflexi bacterium]|nr:MAG: HNH endonuclease [Chloroflexota bacterium]